MIKVINVISDTNIGGAGKMLLTFLHNYDRMSFDMAVVLPRNSLLINEIEALGVRCIEVDGIADKSLDFAAISKLKKIFEKEKPIVVHAHATISARIAARMYGKCKIVHTRHSVFEQSARRKSFPMKQLLGVVNNYLSDSMIAVSPAAMNNMVETGTDPRKVDIVYNGVDPVEPLSPAERSRERARLGLVDSDFVCAIIARLEKVKGHEFILKAAKLFQEQQPSVRILIAGTGSEEQALKEQAKELELDNCIFLGFIKDIRRIEGIMDLQLNASYGTEATSLSLLEGMSLGIPAVATDFGGNPYVIQDGVNGVIVPQRDHLAIYQAVSKLAADPALYAEMQRKSVEIYNNHFTAQTMARGIEELYRRLAAENGSERTEEQNA